MHISVLLLPGVMGSSALGLLDVLTVASFIVPSEEASLTVQRVALNDKPVMAFQGIPLQPDATIASVDKADLILVPSLMLDTRHWFTRQEEVISWVREQANSGARVASVCTGAFVLAEAGLLDGKTATTHWAFAEHFRHRYPSVLLNVDAVLINHGRLLTAGAGMAWQDLLIQALSGMVSDNVLLQLRQTFLMQVHKDGQKPFIGQPDSEHNDKQIEQAQTWMKEGLSNDNVINDVIGRSGLQQRTFQRRFRQAVGMSPVHYLQYQRIEAAKVALLRNELSVENIGFTVGYNDRSFFRRLFRRHTGMSPAEYRKANQVKDGITPSCKDNAAPNAVRAQTGILRKVVSVTSETILQAAICSEHGVATGLPTATSTLLS